MVILIYLPALVSAEPSVTDRMFGEYAPIVRILVEWGGTLMLCLLGGFVLWVDDVRRGMTNATTWWFLSGKLGGSAMSGFIVFLMLKARGTDPFLCGALAGVAGMAGAEWVRKGLVRRLNRAMGVDTSYAPLDSKRGSLDDLPPRSGTKP
jgi:hypothetical protein